MKRIAARYGVSEREISPKVWPESPTVHGRIKSAPLVPLEKQSPSTRAQTAGPKTAKRNPDLPRTARSSRPPPEALLAPLKKQPLAARGQIAKSGNAKHRKIRKAKTARSPRPPAEKPPWNDGVVPVSARPPSRPSRPPSSHTGVSNRSDVSNRPPTESPASGDGASFEKISAKQEPALVNTPGRNSSDVKSKLYRRASMKSAGSLLQSQAPIATTTGPQEGVTPAHELSKLLSKKTPRESTRRESEPPASSEQLSFPGRAKNPFHPPESHHGQPARRVFSTNQLVSP